MSIQDINLEFRGSSYWERGRPRPQVGGISLFTESCGRYVAQRVRAPALPGEVELIRREIPRGFERRELKAGN